MAQKSIVRRGKEISSTSSSQVTSGCEEMCLMAIENSENQSWDLPYLLVIIMLIGKQGWGCSFKELIMKHGR